jgi:hypothetical protein
MTASFQTTHFAPVAYVPPENLPARRDAGPLALTGRMTAVRPAVVHLRLVAGGATAALGCSEVYTARREVLRTANACLGRLIDVYA